MPRVVSPFARRAQLQNTKRAIRARAPKHPVGPEQRLRLYTTKLYRAFFAQIKAAYVRRDAKDADLAHRHSAGSGSAVAAHSLLYQSPWRQHLAQVAADTGASAAKQTAAALKLQDFSPDLADQQRDFAGRVFAQSQDLFASSIDRADDIFDEWSDGEEPTADELDQKLDDGLDGIMGTALSWASVAFGGAFADMVRGAQQEAGCASYMWLSQRDSHTRESHEALDGQICSWDAPPLQPGPEPDGDPSIDEPAHAGQPPNCRCVSSPVVDGDLTDRQEARLPN